MGHLSSAVALSDIGFSSRLFMVPEGKALFPALSGVLDGLPIASEEFAS